MASSSLKLPLLLFVSGSLILQGALAEITCEELPQDMCAFAIASSGKRCSLETNMMKDGHQVEYVCSTSEVVAEKMAGYIETDQYCVNACGVDRKMVGISSDSLLEPLFTAKLCSPACYLNCPNIVNLYFSLASGEGVFLPDLCKAQQSNPHRAMIELESSGAAPGPVSGEPAPSGWAYAPAPSPTWAY